MSGAAFVYWLHALSSLHFGTGRGEGYIDLPLAREKVTRFPYGPASSVKGVFADSWDATDKKRNPTLPNGQPNPDYKPELHAAFGRAGDDSANAGALVFTDARLICLPTRSLYGTFTWCTSRFVLKRLTRDLQMAGQCNIPGEPSLEMDATYPAAPASAVVRQRKAYLEDWDLTCQPCPVSANWAERMARWVFPGANNPWQAEFQARFLVLPDDLFNFLAETGTEVQPHVRIDPEQKRAVEGALWYEESLPPETILAGLVWCDPIRGVPGVTTLDVHALCQDRDGPTALQLGGKATVGKGRTRMLFVARPQAPNP